MKRLAHNNKRDISEKAIVAALRKAGAAVYLMDKPLDMLIGYRGRTFLADAKTGNRGLTEAQRRFIGKWKWAGGPIVLLRNVDDVEKFLVTFNRLIG